MGCEEKDNKKTLHGQQLQCVDKKEKTKNCHRQIFFCFINYSLVPIFLTHQGRFYSTN